jgi:HTH-type transcriptional regulator / antitoxin HigA
MEIRTIQTTADYTTALKAVSVLVDADPKRGTPDAYRLEVLGTLVEAYEARHYPLELPDPIEAHKFRMV